MGKPSKHVKTKVEANPPSVTVGVTDELLEIIVALVKAQKVPVHIAKLSQIYAKAIGHSIKVEHKQGMRNLIETRLGDRLLLLGEHNDTFVRIHTPAAAAMQWVIIPRHKLTACVLETIYYKSTHLKGLIKISVLFLPEQRLDLTGKDHIKVRTTVQEKGPILISMIGRLYHEEKGHDFKDAFPIGLTKFLQKYLGDELNYTTLKGVEMLVECKLDKKPKPEALVKRDEKRAKEGGEEAHSGPVPCVLRARLQSAPKAVPYTKDDKILVVGDGDFSWSRAVAVSFQPDFAKKLLATVLDSSKERHRKYGLPSHSHMRALRHAHAEVRHEIDATALSAGELGEGFDFVVFNFPHVGSDEGLQNSIRDNQKLVRGFLESAAPLLSPKGEVHLTLLNRFPYTAWKVAELGPGELVYCGGVPFEDAVYKEYTHKATTQTARDTRTRMESSTTHVWRLVSAVMNDKKTAADPSRKKDKGSKRKQRELSGEGERVGTPDSGARTHKGNAKKRKVKELSEGQPEKAEENVEVKKPLALIAQDKRTGSKTKKLLRKGAGKCHKEGITTQASGISKPNKQKKQLAQSRRE